MTLAHYVMMVINSQDGRVKAKIHYIVIALIFSTAFYNNLIIPLYTKECVTEPVLEQKQNINLPEIKQSFFLNRGTNLLYLGYWISGTQDAMSRFSNK